MVSTASPTHHNLLSSLSRPKCTLFTGEMFANHRSFGLQSFAASLQGRRSRQGAPSTALRISSVYPTPPGPQAQKDIRETTATIATQTIGSAEEEVARGDSGYRANTSHKRPGSNPTEAGYTPKWPRLNGPTPPSVRSDLPDPSPGGLRPQLSDSQAAAYRPPPGETPKNSLYTTASHISSGAGSTSAALGPWSNDSSRKAERRKGTGLNKPESGRAATTRQS